MVEWINDSERGAKMPIEKIDKTIKENFEEIIRKGKEYQIKRKIQLAKWTKIIKARKADAEQGRLNDDFF